MACSPIMPTELASAMMSRSRSVAAQQQQHGSSSVSPVMVLGVARRMRYMYSCQSCVHLRRSVLCEFGWFTAVS